MPVAKKKPDAIIGTSAPLPVDLLADKKIHKSATADMAITPPESLVLYMEGMPWGVTFYAQHFDKADQLREVDINDNAALQQYRKIHDFELRVQSELSQSYDESTGRNDVTGSSVVSGFIPNTFDYFVTDTGTQGQGLFMITSSTRKTYNNDSVYEVNYTLLGYTDNDSAKDRYEALEARVVSEFHFHKERVQIGEVGLLTTQEHGDVKELRKDYYDLMNHYLAYFISPTDRLLTVPAREHLYDSRLADFVMAVIDKDLAIKAQQVNVVSHDRNPYLSLNSIWTMLLQRDSGLLPTVCRKVIVAERAYFKQNSFMISTNCWNVDGFIFPDIVEANSRFPYLIQFANEPAYVTPYEITPVVIPDNDYTYAGKTFKVAPPVHLDGYYVLPKTFYDEDRENMTLLEIATADYLAGKTPNFGHLKVLVKAFDQWDWLMKFNYGPILMVLLKAAIAAYY